MSDDRKRVAIGLTVLAGIVLSVCVTAFSGVPDPLPDIALGSKALLHFARSAAVFAVFMLALVVVYHGFRGRLPSEISGQGLVYAEVRNEAADGIELVAEAVAALRERVD